MAKLLLNLRNVPVDEADEVRALMDEHGIACYETKPSIWGISFGAIWIARDEDAARAKSLMDEYQTQRRIRVRAELEQARRSGELPSFRDQFLAQPLRMLAVWVCVALLLGLTLALPLILFGA